MQRCFCPDLPKCAYFDACLRGAAGNNNLPVPTSFNSITLSGSGYALGGNSITLAAAGITSSQAFATNTINFNIALEATATFMVTSSGHTLQVFGAISGSSGLTMAGAGLLRLFGNNTYMGTSTLNAGWFSVESTMTASSVTVNSGGTITGSNAGHMGPVTVLSGGTLDPGVSAGGAAIITIEGNLVMSAGSTFVVDLNGVSSPDRVAVNGTVNLGGSTLTVNDNFGSVAGNSFNIIPNDGGMRSSGLSPVCPKVQHSRSAHRPSPSATFAVTEPPTLTPVAGVTATATTTVPVGAVVIPTLSLPLLVLLGRGLAVAGLYLASRGA